MRSRHEAVFDEPDIVEEHDESIGISTDYIAVVTREGEGWRAAVDDLPGGKVVVAHGSTWAETITNIGDALSEAVTPEPPYVLGYHMVPADPDADSALKAVMLARYDRVYAEQAERDAVRQAVRVFLGQGWSTRDAARALLLSQERVEQLAAAMATD
ncbi:type II toxin-antitoxin system HicB family antitoxin [Herbidospora cretacea]|uniref:type II toxin-antitoxin system HicB family antitoxin n=1 Tax=Herbidospora cretacea TaxID=28444 RepID=UPI0004C2DDEB|nr:hypothetical protein [Herbidospora cretacea]